MEDHLGGKPLGTSVRDYLEWIDRGGKTHYECEWTIPWLGSWADQEGKSGVSPRMYHSLLSDWRSSEPITSPHPATVSRDKLFLS